jgi:2-polyprenyl-6-methoxyphenol hydroxylase-like FAD-dependent oxidoreductase
LECRERVFWSNAKQTWLLVEPRPNKLDDHTHIISATANGRFRQVNTKTYRTAIRGKLRKQIALVIRTLVEERKWNDSEIAHYLGDGMGHEVSPDQVRNIRVEFGIRAAANRGRPIGRSARDQSAW